MPGRKSNEAGVVQVQAKEVEDGPPAPPRTRVSSGLGVEDVSLPRSMVARLAKGVLPANTQIQKDALLAMSKSATVFVNYLASNANDRAVLANKKTVQPEDVMVALKELEFDSFLPRCEGELARFSAIQNDKRNTYRRKVRQETQASTNPETDMIKTALESGEVIHGTGEEKGEHQRGQSPPAAKKARTSLSGLNDNDNQANGEHDRNDDDDTIDEDDGDLDNIEDEDEDDNDDEEEEEDQVPDNSLELVREREDLIDPSEDDRERIGQDEDEDSDTD